MGVLRENLVRKHNSSLQFQFLAGFNELVPLNLIKVNIIVFLYLHLYLYLHKMPDQFRTKNNKANCRVATPGLQGLTSCRENVR